ncbi:MAG: hypothetical protein V4739_02505 [Pseudomonadota bacterium]
MSTVFDFGLRHPSEALTIPAWKAVLKEKSSSGEIKLALHTLSRSMAQPFQASRTHAKAKKAEVAPSVPVFNTGDGTDSALVGAAVRQAIETARRRLTSVDGVVDGQTTEDREADASAERVALIWQALMGELQGLPPKLSAADAMACVTGVYWGADAVFTEATWAAFFDANLDANGKLAATLDVSMFKGVDASTVRRSLRDASGLFYASQQSHLRAAGGNTAFEPDALTLADDPMAAQGAFVRALRNDLLQTGTSDYLTQRVDTGDAQADAITNSHSQDFSVAGISRDAIVNGHVTEADLVNHAAVKALLFTGNEVMAELTAQGLWDGPTLAQLDSQALATDPNLAVYEVVYTPAGQAQSITRLLTKKEFDQLLVQHQRGSVHIETDNMRSEYVTSPADDVGANEYSFSYVDANGQLLQATRVPLNTRNKLIAQHEAGKIIILSPTVKDPTQLKMFWAQRALSVYDATRTQIYDDAGNVVSGQSAEIRLAQNYCQQYQHFAGATDTFDFHNRIRQKRTGTLIDPLLDNSPVAAAPQVSDAQALAFVHATMGLEAKDHSLFGFLHALGGVTDTAQLAGHWAQNENNHPDHTTVFLGFGGSHGNKAHARAAVSAAQDALAARGRFDAEARGADGSGLNVALTEVETDITEKRYMDGFLATLFVVSLGADSAALFGAESLLTLAGVEATGEEAASLLARSAEQLAQDGEYVSVEALMLDPASPFSDAYANRIMAQSAEASKKFWTGLGASGLKNAAVGAGLVQVLQGQGVGATEVKPAQSSTLGPNETAGLSLHDHVAAVNQALDLLEMCADDASTAELVAFLHNNPAVNGQSTPSSGAPAIPTPQLVDAIYKALGLPPQTAIPPGTQITREQLGIGEDARVHVDIGGEGPIDSHGLEAGYADSINIQAADGPIGDGTHQTQPPYGPIPNLVLLESWDQEFPFEEGFADRITLQNAPLTDNNVDQIARMINKDGGEIELWVDVTAYKGNIEELARRVGGTIDWNADNELGYGEKVTITIPEKGAHAGLIEQTLELLPEDVRTQLRGAQPLNATDRNTIVALMAQNDVQGLAAFIAALDSPAQQWSAFSIAFQAASRPGRPGAVPAFITELMAALTPQVAANVVSHEQSSILNGSNPLYGNPDLPLYTAGPAFATLITLAQADDNKAQTDQAGAILLIIGQEVPGIGAHLLLTALDPVGSTDGNAQNHALVAKLLSHVMAQGDAGASVAGDLLAALDALQKQQEPRRLGGVPDPTRPVPDLDSLAILDLLWDPVDLSSPTSVARVVGATVAYAEGSDDVTWQALGDRITARLAATPHPSAGLQACEQFFNHPFDTFRDQGPLLGALALEHYGSHNAAQLLIESSPDEAAAQLKRVGVSASTVLFKDIALQSPSAAAAIVLAVLGPDSLFADGFAQVLQWFRATGPSLAGDVAAKAYASPALSGDTARRGSFDQTMVQWMSSLVPAQATEFLATLAPADASRLRELMVAGQPPLRP